ncbi:MAG: 4-hydroxythreonine-4-phosphate dehydrogenase PdxA [Pseudomonadota bacterium]
MPAPLIVSCGDPAGIGPEIAAKAWDALRDVIPFVWLGDPAHLPAGTPFQVISDMADTAGMRDAMPVMSIPFAAAAVPGKPDLSNAEGVIAAIRRGVELVQVDKASALCTAPINKKVLIDGAGFHYPGHTEFLEALTGSGRAVMMLASDRLRVVPATIHIALEDVPEVLTPALLRETIQITAIDLTRRFGIDDPRIAVAGLNPHAGEGGTMGRQEGDWIAGLIADMARDGLKVTGPWPADTLFHTEARKGYDAVIAMYHDQALIPIKTLDFDKGVNTTLGLPFIRTSPDHGTAFDIAGRGIANPTSMIEALRMAWKMAGG